MNWIKKHWVNALLSIASVAIALAAVDFLLHFTTYRSFITKLVYPRHYFQADAEMGFDISLNFATTTHIFRDAAFPVWSNELGCFDRSYGGETPYIYLAGDSFTWGFSAFEDKWGTRAEELLGMRTLKCGVGGHGTRQEFIKASRTLSNLAAPELIVVGYTRGNDVDDDLNFPNNSVYEGFAVRNLAKQGVAQEEAREKYALFNTYCTIEEPSNPGLQHARCWLRNHSVLYNLVKDRVRNVLVASAPKSLLKKTGLIVEEAAPSAVFLPADEEKHLESIRLFKELAKEKKSPLLFVLVPGDNESLKAFLRKENVSYLDLRPAFEAYSQTTLLQWKVDGHWNTEGNRLAGYLVSRFIIENGLAKVADKEARLEKIGKALAEEFGEATFAGDTYMSK